jgi:hypothetical protein
MKFTGVARLSLVIAAYCLLNSSLSLADTQTAEELCRQRNAASCEINGMRFFLTEDDCPRGAKVLRPRGTEHCGDTADTIKAAKEDVVKQAAPAKTDAVAGKSEKTAEGGLLENPYLIIAIIGLLQGLISRLGWGPFIIVALVMPALLAWGIVTSTTVHTAGADYWAYAGFELLKLMVSSLLGWGAGLAAHRGILNLLHK